MRTSNSQRPLNLCTSFALRSKAQGWRFDGRQHDAAEFYSSFTPEQGPLQLTPWQARVGGLIEGAKPGFSPLLLPVRDSCSLQSCISAWADLACQASTCRKHVRCLCVGRPKAATRRLPAPRQGQTRNRRMQASSLAMSARSPDTKRRRARAPRSDQPDAAMGAISARRMAPSSNVELTQAFPAHEDQLNILQTQTAIVFKLPADGVIAKALLASLQGWQRDHHPRQAHPQGSCNQPLYSTSWRNPRWCQA